MSPLRVSREAFSTRSRAAPVYFGYRFYGFRYAG